MTSRFIIQDAIKIILQLELIINNNNNYSICVSIRSGKGCCCRPERHDLYLAYWLWKVTYIPASSLRLIELFISNACAVRATYSFLYVDHGLSQSLRFLPKVSQARGTRLIISYNIAKKNFNGWATGNFPCLHWVVWTRLLANQHSTFTNAMLHAYSNRYIMLGISLFANPP